MNTNTNRRSQIDLVALGMLLGTQASHDILAFFSHELSQPLLVINAYLTGATRLLERNQVDQEKLLQALAKAQQHVEKIGQLINQLKNELQNDRLR